MGLEAPPGVPPGLLTWAWAVCSSRPARSLAAASSSSCSRSPTISASRARARDPKASFALLSSCSISCRWRGQQWSGEGRGWGRTRGWVWGGGWPHLGVVQLGLRAAQLLAQPDGSGLGLTQGPRHVLQLSLRGRGTFQWRLPPDPSRSSPSNPCHTGLVAMISRGQLLGRPAWRIPQQFNAEFPYGPHSPGEGSPLVSLTNHYYPRFT